MTGLLLLAAVFSGTSVLGEIFSYEDWNMKAGEVHTMQSPGYPGPAPLDTRHVWTIRAKTTSSLVVKCDDFHLAPEPCGENGLQIIEGAIRKNECGERSSYEYVSVTSALYLSFSSKTDSNSRLKCTVTAVKKKDLPGYDPEKEDFENAPSYLDLSSEEVDSTEFGGPEGVKKTTCECGWANKA